MNLNTNTASLDKMKMNPVSREICDEAWKKAWALSKEFMNYKLSSIVWDDEVTSGEWWQEFIPHIEKKYNDPSN